MWENGGIMALPTIPPAAQKRPAQAVQDPSHASFEAVRAGPREARKRDPSLDIPASQKQPRRTMKVILAQPRGFCAGVVRAIEIVERALQKYGPPVYVRHEIVHNKHVVENLKAKGARFVEDEAENRDLPVLNATCPLVTKVHNQGKRYVGQGRKLILIGHAGHPEVEGTMGQIPSPVLLVQNEAEVAALDLAPDTPVAYVTQTTLSVDDTQGIIVALQRKF